PLFINETTFVRARVFLENQIPGPIVTHSYFFDASLEERGLPVFSLVTNPDFFWDADTGIYVQDFKPEWEQPLNVEFFENDGNNQAAFNERAGVKINGQNSWELPQKMLGIYFRGGYGSGSLDYPLFHDRDRTHFDDFILRAGGSDWSYTLMRDGLSQSLPQTNTYVGYQGFRPCMVFVNGEYMGIHNIRSRIDEGFVEENYGVTANSYDLIANDGEIEEGGDSAYWVMDALMGEDLSVQANFDAVAEVVDVQDFADYWITEIWSSNSSWGHNVLLWKSNEDGEKWKFLLGDLDRGFTGSTNQDVDNFTLSQNNDYDYARTWIRHMLENPGYADFFAQRFTDHLHTTFHPNRVNDQIDVFVNRIVGEVPYHVDRWEGTTSSYGDGINSVGFWENEIATLRTFAMERSPFMVEDLFDAFELDDAVSLVTGNLPEGAGNIRLNAFRIPGSPWVGPYFKAMPFELTAVPNPGQEFIGWSEQVEEELVALGSVWKFSDTGEDLETTWRDAAYDDSNWASGNAELGYGDGDEVTTVSYGSNANDKHVTTYFRKTFVFEGDTSIPLAGIAQLRRDDGAVVYFNGEEMFRSNMPEGTIGFNTFASDGVGGNAESDLNTVALGLPLVEGENVIAVEIHQISSTSSDISFDLSLSASVVSDEIISDVNPMPLTLTDNSGFAARYEPTGACTLPLVLEADTTLTLSCSPYLAIGTTHVSLEATLTIEPGVEIWFPEDASLIIEGAIQAIGTEESPIVFKANEADGFTSWGHMKFRETAESNVLKYIVIENATQGEHPIHDRAALTAWFSDLQIDHATLVDNYSNPIYAEHSSITLTNSTIHSEVTGDLVNVKYGSALIENCTFIGNNAPDTDAIDYDQVTNGVIRDCEIHSFFGLNSDGIDLGEESDDVLIEGCLIHHCTDKGISIGQNSTATIRNTTICQCALGVALKDLGGADLDHMTFYGNQIAVSAYEKNSGFGGGTAGIMRSLLSNSSDSPVFADSLSVLHVTDSFYDTDTLWGPNVSWANPHFSSPTTFDFTLLEASPAIGASDDSDWGTESHLFLGPVDLMISEIGYAGLEDPDKEWLRLLNTGDEALNLSGYSLSDAVSVIIPAGTWLEAGASLLLVRDLTFFDNSTDQILQWDAGQLANEGERILLMNAVGMVIDHVRYESEAPWPIPAMGLESLQLISADRDNHFASSWMLNELQIGIEEPWASSAVRVYPNPSKSSVWIESRSSIEMIQAFNGLGQQIHVWFGLSNRTELDVSSWSNGTYVLLINGSKTIRLIRQ
ncbi:MAG: CotH kinase family protein, partial [Flavobacteriales bacterium]|nr:CotH kinase family protein [Flavobacteriales bacterium]